MDLLNEIFHLCIIPLLGILVAYVVVYIRKKSKDLQARIDNNIADAYVEKLADLVIMCVEATNQTYVNELKDKNAFDEAAQKEAFSKTYYSVMGLLTNESRKILEQVYKDIPIVVKELIEYTIANNKKYN